LSKAAIFFAMILSVVSNSIRTSFRGLSFILSLIFAAAHAGAAPPVAATDVIAPPAIIIGFVGGFVKHDNAVHSVVQIAAHLLQEYPSGIYVEVFENHHRENAHEKIFRILDTNHDGTLSNQEKQSSRIILYGHSWGASEAVTLARELGAIGIPVLLTIQVDSIAKRGENDSVIPANVNQAANFYQLDGLLHGRSEIRAADSIRTHIIGNFRFNYKTNPINCAGYPWYYRLFTKSHIEIECDPKVWSQVESLIRLQLPTPQP
jgi:hypothetical protein